MKKILSKYKYCRGLQCSKILWLDEHNPELMKLSDEESIYESGIMVGQLAREYFGEYSLVSFNYDLNAMVNI